MFPDTEAEYSPKNIQGILFRTFRWEHSKVSVIRMFAEYSLNILRRIFGSSILGIFSEYSGNISNRRTPNTQRIFSQTFSEHSLNIFLLPGFRQHLWGWWATRPTVVSTHCLLSLQTSETTKQVCQRVGPTVHICTTIVKSPPRANGLFHYLGVGTFCFVSPTPVASTVLECWIKKCSATESFLT